MSTRKKSFLANLIVGALIAVGVISLKWNPEKNLWHQLCDGFFLAAAMLLGSGGLRGIAKTGSFDAMGYGLKSAVQTFLPMLGSSTGRMEEDFYSYKERKAEERKPFVDMLLAGGVYLALSLMCLALYYLL